MSEQATRITLLDSLSGELLKLPYAAMREVGPAAQTLAGLLKLTNRETFSPVADIATAARLPLKTVRNHITQLDTAQWIKNAGRQHTRKGAPRRTCTIRLLKKTTDALGDGGYGMLPWWACSKFRMVDRNTRWKNFPWGARALLSVVMHRLAVLKSAFSPGIGIGRVDEIDFWAAIANYDEEAKFNFTLRKLGETTGLSRHAIIDAKVCLAEWDIVNWRGNSSAEKGDLPDVLYPNDQFAVQHTPSDQGKCYLNIERKAS